MHMTLETDATAVGLDVSTMSGHQILEEIELAAEFSSSDACTEREACRAFIARLAAEGRRLHKITSVQAVTVMRRGERRTTSWEARCVACGHGFNWRGELSEQPPCPKCGNAK